MEKQQRKPKLITKQKSKGKEFENISQEKPTA